MAERGAEEWKQLSSFWAQPPPGPSREAGRRRLLGPRELAVRLKWLPAQGLPRLPRAVHLLLCALTAPAPAAAVALLQLNRSWQPKGGRRDPRHRDPESLSQLPIAFWEHGASVHREHPSHFSLSTLLIYSHPQIPVLFLPHGYKQSPCPSHPGWPALIRS